MNNYQQDQQPNAQRTLPMPSESGRHAIATTSAAWFMRGLAVGILVCGAANAVSYFFRSDGWGNLLGIARNHREALGFPVQLWETQNMYGGYFIDVRAFTVDALFALLVAIALGVLAVRFRSRLNLLVARLEPSDSDRDRRRGSVRISLAGLLVAMALAAVGAIGIRYIVAGRPEVIGAIYLFGPWLLIAIAYLPNEITWQRRVLIVVPSTLALIAGAGAAGARVNPSLELDKVLLGIFVCWTPQTVLVALVYSAALLLRIDRVDKRADKHAGRE